ncbi:MAG: hypothetical protein KCHDKBKB_01841 [Elusimicrobia bacterium]|nr:hypothetical protein [Elusimicrobiota bacterium]
MNIVIESVFGFVLFLIVHVFLWRKKPSNEPRIILLSIVMFSTLLGLGLFSSNRSDGNINHIFTVLCFEIFLFTLYAYFYSGICRSVSITLLTQLMKSPTLNIESLTQEYARSSRFEDRLVVMEQMGVLKISNGNAQLTQQGNIITRVILFISWMISGKLEG